MSDSDVVLVTHVDRFVGPAAVKRLVQENCRLVCHSDTFTDADARNRFEQDVSGAVALAATEPDAIVAEVMDRFGRIDALVSNDPYPAVRAPVDEAEIGELRQTLEALIVRPFALIGKTAAVMKAQNGGRIVIVSSAAPLTGIPNYAMYATARGGANAMVLTLSKELARWGISVNGIAPNYIKTPEYFPPDLLANDAALGKMLKNIPLGRLGEAEEVAELVALFASGRCGFVTGHIVPIAGGWA